MFMFKSNIDSASELSHVVLQFSHNSLHFFAPPDLRLLLLSNDVRVLKTGQI